MVEGGQIPAIHGVVRWRRKHLAMGVGGVPGFGERDDGEPDPARARLFASSRPAPAIMFRLRERLTLAKSLSRAPGRGRARQGDRSPPHRGLVR
jgi:hypothetical protein